jgi:hypothetical protein
MLQMSVRSPEGLPARATVSLCAVLLCFGTAACSDTAAVQSAPAGAETGAPYNGPAAPLSTYAADGAPEESPATSAPEDAAPGRSDAEVVVTYWNWNAADRVLDVSGYVSGVVQADGRCTVTLTRGSTVLSEESEAYPDSSTTACAAVQVAIPAGGQGDWEAVLEYESSSVGAASAPFTVTVR